MLSSTTKQVLYILYSSELIEFFIKSVKVNVSLIVVYSFLAKRLRYLTVTFSVLYMGQSIQEWTK